MTIQNVRIFGLSPFFKETKQQWNNSTVISVTILYLFHCRWWVLNARSFWKSVGMTEPCSDQTINMIARCQHDCLCFLLVFIVSMTARAFTCVHCEHDCPCFYLCSLSTWLSVLLLVFIVSMIARACICVHCQHACPCFYLCSLSTCLSVLLLVFIVNMIVRAFTCVHCQHDCPCLYLCSLTG